jgi:hypothetical protein
VSNYQRYLLWDVEPSFRDTKDLRFGMGMAEIRIAEPERRDRLLLISAFAMALLTNARVGGREPGDGPAAQVQHIKDAHTLAVPPRVHAVCPFSIGLHENSHPDFLFPVDVTNAGMRSRGRALSDG